MTIVKELNDLAEKMTGTNPNKKTIAKVLDYIEQNYTAGGGSSTGSNVFIVTGSTTDYIHYTIDKTYQELFEAYTQGKPIIYKDEMGSTFLYTSTFEGEVSSFYGSLIILDELNVLTAYMITISESEGIRVEIKEFSLTPLS